MDVELPTVLPDSNNKFLNDLKIFRCSYWVWIFNRDD